MWLKIPILLLSTALCLCSCTGQTEVKQDTSSSKPPQTNSVGPKFVDAATLPDTDDWTKELLRRHQTAGMSYAVGARVVSSHMICNTGSATKGISVSLGGPALQKGILSGENAVRIAVGVKDAGKMKQIGTFFGNLAMTAPGLCTASYPSLDVPAKSYIQLTVISKARTSGKDERTLTIAPLESGAGAFAHSDTINVQ